MAHFKKRRRHFCRRHPEVPALGKCKKCGSRLCGQCAQLRDGKYFCIEECGAQLPDLAPNKAPVNPLAPSETAAPSFSGLMLWAGITLGLCGVVFGLWEMRRNIALEAQYGELKEKRLDLLGYIKNGNREIAELRGQLDTLKRARAAAAQKKDHGAAPASGMDEPAAPGGLPISFDNGAAGGAMVALTFDGSSLSNAAGDILDTLKSRNVKATVFVTGDFLRAFPDAVRRIVGEGHEAGNHTFSHPHLTSWAQDHTHTTLPQVTEEFLRGELSRTDSAFFSITGRHCSPIWRAPFGEKNRVICLWAQRCGYLHIGWRQGKSWKLGLDSNDWVPDEETPGFHTPEEVLEKILALARSAPDGIAGGIILMHLGTVRKDSRAQVHRILGTLIDDLKQLGYTFVTVSEMLKESGIDVSDLEKNRQSPGTTLMQ
jgi:peptidoglycan-N-acetylmuramic acid deacetylase